MKFCVLFLMKIIIVNNKKFKLTKARVLLLLFIYLLTGPIQQFNTHYNFSN